MSEVIGIDLGTTYSCVACLNGGQPAVIPNLEGNNTTPSVVSFLPGGQRLVGLPAWRQAITNPEDTVYSVKRLIGKKFNSPEMEKLREKLPYKIIEAPNGDILIEAGKNIYTPQEISAFILGYLKECAENYLGTKVEEAVITVPAYFNDHQRQATKDAATICGLKVLRIINEPTAASLAYGFNTRKNGKVAVYDLGGGTFDITVLEIHDGVFHVLSTSGDTFLGGDDFDNRLIGYLLDEFYKEQGIDLSQDKYALQRIKEAAERAKKELSFTPEVEINLPFICSSDRGSLHIQKKINRSFLENLTRDLVEKTINICAQALKDAGLDVSRVDEVILVGGQTRMPLVRQAVADYFGRQPAGRINPDEIVAIGAALQAEIIKGWAKELVLLLDVTPFSLGIETEKGIFQKIIEKNTTIPARKTMAFTTVENNQRRVKIHVLQGESLIAAENKSLATFDLVGIDPAPAGVPQIDVTFEIDADGILRVSARDAGTGREQKVEIKPAAGLLPEQLEEIIKKRRKKDIEATDDEEGLL
ncbi:MAG: molecular chaperone DnaK [Candidatus Saccharicenans sp.]|nr:molecular chaperone DnaK [Candidatus Aminicenantes bacterium]